MSSPASTSAYAPNSLDLVWHLLNPGLATQNISTGAHSGVESVKSQASEPPPLIPIVNKVPSLFALVIGIDEYESEKLTTLRGAVADANEVQAYLENDLGVPSSQIRNLRNAEAKRAAIINAFLELQLHPKIKRDDAILIFYAGHGGSAAAPTGWEAGGGEDPKIQMLIPYDYNTEIDQVFGIPDRTIGALIDGIAKQHGDNITVIFDSCHSGSGTRKDPTRVPRSVDIESKIPNKLDQNIWESLRGERGGTITPGFLPRGLSSHVLLAACGEAQSAIDDRIGKRGVFTRALLAAIRAVGADKITYSGLLERMDRLPLQDPQCEGVNHGRILFNSKAPSLGRVFYQVRYEDNEYIMDAGAAHGITSGAEFALYKDRTSPVDPASSLCTLVAKDENIQPLKTFFTSDVPATPLVEPAYALQTKAGVQEDVRLHVETDSELQCVSEAVVQEMQRTGPDRGRIVLVEKDKAHLGIALENGLVVFNILDPLVTRYGLIRMPFRVPPTSADVYPIILAAAHYYWHLNRTNVNTKLQGLLQIEFMKLKKSIYLQRWMQPDGDNLNREGVIELITGKGEAFGMKITNFSLLTLYTSIFLFNTSDFGIELYYEPPTSAQSLDPPLKPNGGSLTVGYGSGGWRPFEFLIPDGQEVDVGIFKLFITTEPVNYSHVRQRSPFDRDPSRTAVIYKRETMPIFATINIPVVQRRG